MKAQQGFHDGRTAYLNGDRTRLAPHNTMGYMTAWYRGYDFANLYTMWETRCCECGGTVLTDEWSGGEPYCDGCHDCGSNNLGEWIVSDEPHPAIWG